MLPSVDAVCVNPLIIKSLWPSVRSLIYEAIRRADLSAFAPIETNVLLGRSLLWLAVENNVILSAAATELQQTEQRKVCIIVACGGRDMPRWLHLIEHIEKFAKVEGCSAVRTFGRKGWQKMLKDYRAERVILEKAI